VILVCFPPPERFFFRGSCQEHHSFYMVLVFSFLVKGLWHLFLGSSGVLLRASKLVEYNGFCPQIAGSGAL